MTYKQEQIAETLKNARKAKGISQRELSKIVSVPQSHLSKIESRGVDLRLSSLVEIARALDLEVELVPRKQLTAVRMISKSSTRDGNDEITAAKTTKELQRLQNTTTELLRNNPAVNEIRQLQSRIKDLNRLQIPSNALTALKRINRSLDAFAKDSTNLSAINESVLQLQHLRNQLVHGQVVLEKSENVPSLYTLDDEDNV